MKNKYKYEIVKCVTFFFGMFVLNIVRQTIKVEALDKQEADSFIKFHYPEYEVKAQWQIHY